MELTADAVQKVFDDCLFTNEEDTNNFVKGEGVARSYGFHPGRLASHKNTIRELLAELPDQFHASKGGGWTFLNACIDRNGVQWGEHVNVEILFALGCASELAHYQMPREMWSMLPGGMPYCCVDDLNK